MDSNLELNNFGKSIKRDNLDQVILFQFEYFEAATQQSVDDLKRDYDEAKKKYDVESSKIPHHINESNYDEMTEEEWNKIDIIGDYYQEMDFSKEYLQSLLEMRIVYMFKNIEIIMKNLIQIAYPNVNTKEFYNWEAMKSFFKSKNIDISSLEGYNDCVDTKKLNNSIKHSDTYNESIYKIPEISEKEELLHIRLEKFYNRIKPNVEKFCKELKNTIKEDLYIFSDDRIKNIAKDFKNRMDKKTLEKFIQKLN